MRPARGRSSCSRPRHWRCWLVSQALLAGPQAEFDDGGGWLRRRWSVRRCWLLLALLPWLHARHSRYRHANFGLSETRAQGQTRAPAGSASRAHPA